MHPLLTCLGICLLASQGFARADSLDAIVVEGQSVKSRAKPLTWLGTLFPLQKES